MKSWQSPTELSLPHENGGIDTSEVAIHKTAIVHPDAILGVGVQVGPHSIVGPNVAIGDGTKIESNVVIEAWTTLGANCRVCAGAVLGGEPQDQKFKGERSYLKIGDSNTIREYVTIHRATGEENETLIGNNNFLMAYCHIGHNCTLGDYITMANMVGISGHVVIEDKAVFGGMVGVHQFVRVGKLAMIGGHSKVVQDVPPFMMADGRPAKVSELNVIGLRRSGVAPSVRAGLRQAYKLLYRSSLNRSQSIEMIDSEIEPSPERDYLLEFVRNVKFGFAGRQLEHRG